MSKLIKILIVDDHKIFNAGLKALLEQDSAHGLSVVGTVEDGIMAIDFVRQHYDDLDIVMLDLNMPNLGGLKTTRILKKDFPKIKVLILTQINDSEQNYLLLKEGVDGIVLKENSADNLSTALKFIQGGKTYIDNGVFKPAPPSPNTTQTARLSPIEIRIACLIKQGKKTLEIATELDKTDNAIEKHRYNIFRKLGIRNMADLIEYASTNNLCEGKDGKPS